MPRLAVVRVERILLEPSDDAEESQVVLRDDAFTVDLSKLTSTSRTAIDGVSVPAGTYSWVAHGGDHVVLRVKFDIADSYGHAAGGSDAWVMRPSVSARDVTFSATVQLEVSLPSPDAGVSSTGHARFRVAGFRRDARRRIAGDGYVSSRSPRTPDGQHTEVRRNSPVRTVVTQRAREDSNHRLSVP